MKLSKFQKLTAALSDDEFLAHPDVRRVYWDALDTIEAKYFAAPAIPGSLADAVEQMRCKVIDTWLDGTSARWSAIENASLMLEADGMIDFVVSSPRNRFLIFAAALGVIENDKVRRSRDRGV